MGRVYPQWGEQQCRDESLSTMENINEENKHIPSTRSGREIGPAMATATRDKKATSVNCISAVCIEGSDVYKKGRPATKIDKK